MENFEKIKKHRKTDDGYILQSHWTSSDTVEVEKNSEKTLTTKITEMEQATSAKYTKPNSGIPKSDLAQSVQTSLGKADTAIQDISGKADKSTTLAGYGITDAINSNKIGANNGVASLDANGKVPSSQLPSYVDDVIEGYYYNSKFYKESSYTTQITGETGKIYINLSDNKTYRWSGSQFTVISETLALGETSSTAYRGDYGKIAYDYSQAQHAPVDAQKNVQSDWNATSGDAFILNKPTFLTGGSQTTTSNSSGGSNVYTFTKSDGTTSTLTVKNGVTPTIKSANGTNIGVVGTPSVTASTSDAETTFTFNNLKGEPGTNGTRGSRWTTGTAITGTATSNTQFTNSEITDALVNDMYLNTSTSNIYRCTVSGNATNARWVYVGNIKGASGSAGSTSNATTTTAGLMSAADKSKLDSIASNANNYSLPDASSTTKGGMKLYTASGTNTDGTMTQKSVTEALEERVLNTEFNNLRYSETQAGRNLIDISDSLITNNSNAYSYCNLASNKYVLSFDVENLTGTLYVAVKNIISNTSDDYRLENTVTSNGHKSFQFENACNYIEFYCYSSSEATIKNVMLEIDKETAYKPYIQSNYELYNTVSKISVFDLDKIRYSKQLYYNENNRETLDSLYHTSTYIPVLSLEKLIFSFFNTGSGLKDIVYINCYDKYHNFIGNSIKYTNVTAGKNIIKFETLKDSNYIRISVNKRYTNKKLKLVDMLTEDINTNLNEIKSDIRSVQASKAIASDEYNLSTTYGVGDYCIYDSKLWKCKIQCQGQTPAENTYWTRVNLGSEVKQLNLSLSVYSGDFEISKNIAAIDAQHIYRFGNIVSAFVASRNHSIIQNTFTDLYKIHSEMAPKSSVYGTALVYDINGNYKGLIPLRIDTNGWISINSPWTGYDCWYVYFSITYTCD